MYNEIYYTGSELPNKALCLTYDDGPGIYTAEIAQFLYEQGIKATFFVVGKYATNYPDVLNRLKKQGHLIGNHTYDHPDVTYYQSINGDIQHQILKTDAVIKNYSDDGKIYFRPPYGKWSKEVASELNENLIASLNHIGPIYWDVGGVDCYYWQQGLSVKETVDKYVVDINKIGKGIVLLHDDIADMDVVKHQNKTLELTKQLIPILKEQGYKFVRLDEIETIKNAAQEVTKFKIQNSKGKYFSVTDKNEVLVGNFKNKSSTSYYFEILDLGMGKVAIKSLNGFYLNNVPDQSIAGNGKIIDDNSSFDLIPISSNQFMFRCSNGNFFTTDNKNESKLLSVEKYMKGGEVFFITPIYTKGKKKKGFKSNFGLLKKRILYIKSKILQS